MKKMYTGMESMDKSLRMAPGDLVVIGSRPAMGKTAFLIRLMNDFSKNNVKCKFFSLELDEKDLTARIFESTSYDEKAIFSNTAFHFERTFTKEKLEAETDSDVRVILIDYLQLLDVNGFFCLSKSQATNRQNAQRIKSNDRRRIYSFGEKICE